MFDSVDVLLSRMTLDEKVGQLNHLAAKQDTTGASGAASEIESRIRRGELGSLAGGCDTCRSGSLQATSRASATAITRARMDL